MNTKVTITFEVPENKYNAYEKFLQRFDDNLQNIGILKVDIHESNADNGVTISKDVLCEIDSELFFDKISMETKSWSYDYDDLAENTEVFEYIQKYYPNELKALENGDTDYLTVYYD